MTYENGRYIFTEHERSQACAWLEIKLDEARTTDILCGLEYIRRHCLLTGLDPVTWAPAKH